MIFANGYDSDIEEKSWGEILKNETLQEYKENLALWERCKDAFKGEDAVKKRVNYIYRPVNMKDNKAFNAYVGRAEFPNYPNKDLIKKMGVLTKSPSTLEVNESLEFFRDEATSDKASLEKLRLKTLNNILRYGRYHLWLKVGDVANKSNPFYVEPINADKFLECEYIENENGETYLKWVLLDASTYEYNRATKKREFTRALLVLGLDANGFYYTATLKPSEWLEFNLDEPQSGIVEYPMIYGNYADRIPFFVFNTVDLSFGHYQEPPFLNLINLCFHIYNCSAVYNHTLFMSAEPTLILKSADSTNDMAKNITIGANRCNQIGQEDELKFLEFTGAGATAQKVNIDDMCKRAESMGVSIASIDGAMNVSGVALSILREDQTSSLTLINNNVNDGIEIMLRFAYKWLYPSYDNKKIADDVKFTVNNSFSEVDLLPQELSNLVSNRKSFMITKAEVRQIVEKNLNLQSRDFDELMAELDAENSDEVDNVNLTGLEKLVKQPFNSKTNDEDEELEDE